MEDDNEELKTSSNSVKIGLELESEAWTEMQALPSPGGTRLPRRFPEAAAILLA